MLIPAQWFVAVAPIDLRCGIDRLLVTVESLRGSDAFDGAAYLFRNRAGTRLKLLLVDATGVWLCVRRLHQGRFFGPGAGDAFCAIDAEQFAWLCAGVDWQRLSTQKVFARRV